MLGLIVSGALAAAPSAASAATTYATIHSECWIREYPPDATCDQGWIGAIAIGQTNFGESIALFGASWSLPTGAEVTDATLRLDIGGSQTVYLGQANNLDWYTDTWWTWDTSNVDVFTDFSTGVWGTEEVDITDYVANHAGGGFFGLFADPGGDFSYVEDIEIEIEYDL
ncbi:hypothetical protein OJ997_09465 [Solirubrobacter phytolaccae]|uniref:Uncharacterized protein n=1 Tax=Solirubrobacter phytolaccae TaxID=1404360 RepID=A0A9X3NAM5_9ACTN|nr:hypothetical protein [Solirubrobacter phytolaccae]MDA0180521.1 hypothetical protein [Solirubrobacter phytolaccae]